MAESFSRRTWTNDTGLRLNATNLNDLEGGIETIDDRAAALELGVTTPVTISYTSTITPSAAAGALFRVAASGDLTLNEPTGGTDGQTVSLEVVATGGDRVMSFAGGALTPVSIPAGELCVVSMRYRATDTAWVVLDIQGFTGSTAPPPSGGSGTTPARFPGDPGVGKVLTGATVYTGSMGEADGNSWLDNNTGVNHLFKRTYYANLWSRTAIQSYRNSGKMPSIAWKANGDATNIAAIAGGSIDAAITAEAQWAAGVGYPIYTAFYHEPEDNFESDQAAADYRAAYRRIVNIFKTNGATNVVWIGVAFMASWSFLSSGGGQATRGPWYKWDPDWKGTSSGAGRPNAADWYTGSQAVCDLMSFDQYSPTIGASGYHEFFDDIGVALSRMAADGKPLKPWIIPEMGTKVATGMPGDGWTGYFQRAFRYMRDNGGVGFVYYNTDDNNFLNGSDAVARFAGYQAALASEASYLVSTRPPDAGVASTATVSFVGAGVDGGNKATLTTALPPTALAGDVAYLFWTHSSTSTITSDPTTAGWTQIANNTGSTGSGVAKVLRKVLAGGDASPAMVIEAATRQSAVVVVYRGLNTTTPEEAIAVDTTGVLGTAHNAPAVTTTNSSVLVTSIHERATNIDTDWTAGAGYTVRGDTTTSAVGTTSTGTITAVADNGPTIVAAGTHTPTDWVGDHATGTANVVTYTLALRVA